MDTIIPEDTVSGLTTLEATALAQKFGGNELSADRKNPVLRTAWDVVREPMFAMLLLACVLYLILGELQEGVMMIIAMVFVGAISFYQEVKSSNALAALRKYTEPRVLVVRDGEERMILSKDLVPGDVIAVEEGQMIPADAALLQSNDLSINESILTGESFPVEKTARGGERRIFQGTLVNSGRGYAKVTAIGNNTALGKLGKSISSTPVAKTLLQKQIGRFVRTMAFLGGIVFCLLLGLTYWHTGDFLTSLLAALTLIMAIVPEEIPVAFSSFMALGAFRMARRGIITRQPMTIENLGAVSVICLDKTGTITENKMKVVELYDYEGRQLTDPYAIRSDTARDLLKYARLASEVAPFDTMEKAIVECWQAQFAAVFGPGQPDIIHEYPLSGRPPMMTHVYRLGTEIIAAAKGAPERILTACRLAGDEAAAIEDVVSRMASKGYRVIGVCSAPLTGSDPGGPPPQYPAGQDDFNWRFKGLVALYDPPLPDVKTEFGQWRRAGIAIKLLTGDYRATAENIAAQVGLVPNGPSISGDDIMEMPPGVLSKIAESANIFVRMFPAAKQRLVEALKDNGEVVTMMGDGVNDGPALRSAHIGIAMGSRGTEIARQSADLILTDERLVHVTEAIRQGRKIYHNFKKAVRYIISIHVPIILTASLPVILNWRIPGIFTPIHIIFLELIMGPTCSIFFENEPAEPGIMRSAPRPRSGGIFTSGELSVSLFQGLVITSGILGLYRYYMAAGYPLPYVRTVVFLTLIMSNVFLTFTNRSFEENILTTFRYPNKLARYVVALSLGFVVMLVYWPGVRDLFGLARPATMDFLVCLAMAAGVTWWFELYKTFFKRKTTNGHEKGNYDPGTH